MYTSSKAKYEDINSSAITFLLVGGAGFIIMLLLMTDIIKLPFNIATTVFFNTVMTGVFILFIIIGIVSAVSASKLKKKISYEIKTSADLKAWLNENVTADIIDSLIENDVADEEKYYERINIIKEYVLRSQFASVDEAFLDSLLEEFYGETFE